MWTLAAYALKELTEQISKEFPEKKELNSTRSSSNIILK